jgi:hypothetical protein
MRVMTPPDPTAERVLSERIPHEALRLHAAAATRSLTLRLTGSLAVKLHCERYASLLTEMGRRPYRDIDFFGYSKEQGELARMFEADGYIADRQMKHAQEWGVKRLIYEHPETHIKVDVFMDELVMAHSIDFKGRLGLDAPTVDLADLLLSKLQIHEITENDLMDIAILMAEHDVGTGDREQVDAGRIAAVLKDDWGFFHTTLENLAKAERALDRYPTLPAELAEAVRGRIQTLRERIEAQPKGLRWKLRARVGTRTKWYEDVDEVDR